MYTCTRFFASFIGKLSPKIDAVLKTNGSKSLLGACLGLKLLLILIASAQYKFERVYQTIALSKFDSMIGQKFAQKPFMDWTDCTLQHKFLLWLLKLAQIFLSTF